MKEFKLAFGRGTQSVMLPEDHISDVLEGVPTPACDAKKRPSPPCGARSAAPRLKRS